MTEASFLRDWRARLRDKRRGVVLVDPRHPLEVYAGASEEVHPLLQIRSRSRPPTPDVSALVHVSRFEADSRWVLSLELQDDRFTEVFLRLAAHLVGASASRATPDEAWAAVLRVLDEWRRLLRGRSAGLLSLDELRGLVGELWLVANRFAETRPIGQALEGWLGPMGAPQDFWFEDTGFHEAKAIGPGAPHIRISSAEQLDEPDMELVILQLPQTAESEQGAISLITLLEHIRSALASDGHNDEQLDLRLRRLGVEPDQPFYAETWFRVQAIERLRIVDTFPAVRASTLPDGIERVRYSLDRRAIAPFITSTDNL